MPDNALISLDQAPWQRRCGLFACTFAVCCLAGMSYTYLRPAVYQSTATLKVSQRTTTSVSPNPNPSTDDPQQEISTIAVQRHLASHPSVIAKVFDRFAEKWELEQRRRPDGTLPDLAEVAPMLSAHAVPETDFVELRAEGGQPDELAYLVRTWTDVLLAEHAAAEQQMTESTSTAIHKQLGELEDRVGKQRRELAAFRETHDIASMQREENLALARMNGLTTSLSAAEAAAAAATARFDAVQAALSEGNPLQTEETDSLLIEMETRAADALEWLHQREAIYSAEYLSKDKKAVETKDFLEFLAGAIDDRRAELEQRALASAEFEMAAAEKTVANMRADLAKQVQTVTEFTTRFAEHEALNEDLLQLEALHRQLRERVVQTEVMREALPPELSVAQSASLPVNPIRPNYSRDAVLSLIGSLLLGLLAVVIDWLATRPPVQPAQLQTLESRTIYYPLLDSQRAAGQAVRALGEIVDAASISVSAAALEYRPARELSPDEVTALLVASEPATRSVLSFLLSGVTVNELRALKWSDIDLAAGQVRVSGADARSVTLAPAVVETLAAHSTARGEPAGYLWQNANAQPLSGDAIHALVTSAAHVAAVKDAALVDADTIRHTYVAFLARQGLPHGELAKIVGRIPEQSLQTYELMPAADGRIQAADASLCYTSLAVPQSV